MCVYVSFIFFILVCYIHLMFVLNSKIERKYLELSGWGFGENVGGIWRGVILVRIYFMKINLNYTYIHVFMTHTWIIYIWLPSHLGYTRYFYPSASLFQKIKRKIFIFQFSHCKLLSPSEVTSIIISAKLDDNHLPLQIQNRLHK